MFRAVKQSEAERISPGQPPESSQTRSLIDRNAHGGNLLVEIPAASEMEDTTALRKMGPEKAFQ